MKQWHKFALWRRMNCLRGRERTVAVSGATLKNSHGVGHAGKDQQSCSNAHASRLPPDNRETESMLC